MCGIYTGNKLAKFHGNILSLSENIAKSFRGGGYFLTHTVYMHLRNSWHHFTANIYL